MKNIFLKLFIFTTLFLVFPTVSLAQVFKIVFTTDPQTIESNTLSGPMTIQTQDSGGASYQTPETIDLEFTSTSATGEFLGGTGNAATAYMSKNTANRTFYYRDSAQGVFTVSIRAMGRESGKEWGASQQITVGELSASQNVSGEVFGASTSGSSSSSSGSSGGSTTKVSSTNSQIEAVAGIDRITSVGSPIWFQASIKKNTTANGAEFGWSFGDGNVGVGQMVSHTYKYPGDYVVVLNARAGDMFSVSRLKVKVIDSEIFISDGGEYLEISNNGNMEINLFNWRLENEGKGFVFQPNTIILPKSSIKFDKTLLKMKGSDNSMGISLKNYLGEEVFYAPSFKKVDLEEVSKNLEDIKREFSIVQEKAKSLGISGASKSGAGFYAEQTAVLVSDIKESNEEDEILLGEEAEEPLDNIIYQAPKNQGIFGRAWSFLSSVLR